MNDTRSEILRLATELIWSVGYNNFSYADISKKLHIKNAAIHYYFPTKSDLGVEVIRLNLDAFKTNIENWKNLSLRQQYERYITMHDNFVDKNWVCIVGSLSPSFDTLPENMQAELQKLVDTILQWLTDLLANGKEKSIFSFTESPHTKASMIHSTLLSALLMNKVLKNDIYENIQQGLLMI